MDLVFYFFLNLKCRSFWDLSNAFICPMEYVRASKTCPFLCCIRDADINIQKIGRIQTKNREVSKITCNFNGTKLARNWEVAKFGCQNGQNCLQK